MRRTFEERDSQAAILIGYRGTGKSALLNKVAKPYTDGKLNVKLVAISGFQSNDDTDAIVDIIYKTTGDKPVKSFNNSFQQFREWAEENA